MTRLKYLILPAFILLASCSGIPGKYSGKNVLPDIFPDITGVTIPVNIAPLNFRIEGRPEKVAALFECRGEKLSIHGKRKIEIPGRQWHGFIRKFAGDSLNVTVFVKDHGKWSGYLPFRIYIKNAPIDPWMAYRLIAPGYESWSEMGIYQRDLTSFRQETIIDNRLLPGNCMNCHSFNNNDPNQMVFHLRGNISGTMLIRDGKAVKLNTKTKETIGNCVYPCWHPSGNYIAFSVNSISQLFHTVSEKRIEVVDSKSDIVVYDVRANKLITTKLISSEDSFETFPIFSADGKTLIFCSAKKRKLPDEFSQVKYSLCKIGFDPATGTFGREVDTIISSFRTGRSISFPRTSHDGRYLMFTMSDYGNFSIWHQEADLYLLNLSDGTWKPMNTVNSNRTESYHSWSSGSHWFVFSSRRIDGLYTRPYFAWLDDNGEATKPFLLPQKDPDFYDNCLRSFNVPELITGKVKANGRNMLNSIGSGAKNVTFELKD
ncbi:MAG: hypothetical protein ABSG89_00835 [Bacteroidales bacterium]|jgi:hypothetical protein